MLLTRSGSSIPNGRHRDRNNKNPGNRQRRAEEGWQDRDAYGLLAALDARQKGGDRERRRENKESRRNGREENLGSRATNVNRNGKRRDAPVRSKISQPTQMMALARYHAEHQRGLKREVETRSSTATEGEARSDNAEDKKSGGDGNSNSANIENTDLSRIPPPPVLAPPPAPASGAVCPDGGGEGNENSSEGRKSESPYTGYKSSRIQGEG